MKKVKIIEHFPFGKVSSNL